MSELFIPAILAFAGILAALATYRGIRRGGARFYTLEREALLRRAIYTLFLSMVLFLAAIGYFVYERQTVVPATAVDDENAPIGLTTTPPTVSVEQFPPTDTATPDEIVPTVTPTVIVCRAIVDGTSGNGLTLRDVPGGDEITILPDGSVLTVLEDEPTDINGLTWRKVRVVGGEEGWVAEQFLTIRAPCN